MAGSNTNTAAPGPRVLHALEGLALVVSVLCILTICALILVGVITRAAFNWSLPDMEIIVRDLMIGAVILPLAYVSAGRTHIAVDVFVAMMPKRWLPAVDLLGSVVGLLVLLPIVWGGWLAFRSAWVGGAYAYGEFEIPEWPVRLTFWLGYLIFTLRLAALVVGDLRAAIRGDAAAAAPTDKG